MNRIKALVAAVALTVTGVAAAIPVTGTASDLYISAYEFASGQTYVFDTGLTWASFTTAPSAQQFDLTTTANGAQWGSFLTAIAGKGGSAANIQIGLFGFFNTAASQSLFTQTGSGQAIVNSTISNIAAQLNTVALNANNICPAGYVACVIDGTTTSQSALQLIAGGTGTGDLQGQSQVPVVGLTGSSLNIYQYVPGARGTTTGVATLLGGFSVTSAGLATITPVPEPGTYALMAAGLLALGAVARRRMR